MRRLCAFVVWVTLGCAVPPTQAASMALDLMDSRDFYQLIPRQGPLAEQFSTIVSSPPSPIRVSQKNAVRIALLLFGDVDSIENRSLLVAFRKRMRELNIDYRLDTYTDKSEWDGDLTSYLKITDSSPDYVVVTKLGSVQRRFLERFLRSGKPKVILYNFASPLTHWINHPPLMYIGFDQKKATSMLASYLDRQLPAGARISALILPPSYLGYVRCDLFLDEMQKYKRRVERILEVPDDKQEAFVAAKTLLKEGNTDFIFSCAQGISEGVVAALQTSGEHLLTQTNTWGVTLSGLADLESRRVKVSVLFMKDDLAIAVAEAIKLDLEGRNMPNLYVANATLMPAELDSESLRLMMLQAHHYSVELWQK
ncbi:type 1 periplasmic-binding domain-containing protein [Marinomonas shanghaiensis]|jgi:autoinducer 2-binding periplasmic protein LuxP|uniref:substrate-binding domain-containing protein n=1 Tax=Marinomonas shanghaiensis TaxID=2202418 RepID=UPI000DBAB3AE|nr:substrate-binding domain-containing protein [Marinomonas shanghaiensis]